jgi:hypothetical protein
MSLREGKFVGKFILHLSFPILLFFSFLSFLHAQNRFDPQGMIQSQLTDLVQARYGSDFQFVAYNIIDSLIYYSKSNLENIQDPYGTLKGCILFSVHKANLEGAPDTFVVGMLKNGQIIWDNAPGTIADLGGDLLYAQDINSDGEVDLLISEIDDEFLSIGKPPFLYYLYILSWNGLRGRFVNSIREDQTSAMIGDGGFELVDKTGDGIKEVKVALPDIDIDWDEYKTSTYPYITYGWNGSQYGFWPNTGQIGENEFLPANKLQASVKCNVRKADGLFHYDYAVSNASISRQMISDIYVGGMDDTTENLAPALWQSGSSRYVGGRAFIKYAPGTYYLIHPGHTQDGFRTISSVLPTIVKYYVQGYTQPAFGTEEEERQNIYNNSVNGYTLGTSETSGSFILLDFLDTLTSYTTQSRTLGWIKDQTTANKYLGYFSSAKTSLQQNNIASTRTTLQQILQDANIDSTSNLTSEAYALIHFNTEYLLAQLPTAPAAGCNVKLINSAGAKLTGGSLQYYEGSWKDATNNNDGTFFVNTTAKTISLRMTYEYGTQTKSNVPVGPDTVVFQTINTQVKLQNSQGAAIDTGSVQYYAGAWRNFGATTNGTAVKELLPNNYSFRMTYAYASKDKQQDIGADPMVVFQTVNAAVQLQNSQGVLIDQGIVQYYSGAWQQFGTTANGIANKELLPNNYSFRMTYAYASKDKQQDIGVDPTVVFQTINAAVQLQNSQGTLIDQGTVQYYSGAWRQFGTTVNGTANKELLPNNYSFRMTYAYASKDKQQDVGTNPTVVFQTINAVVQLQNSQGALIDQGTAQYYSGAWREFGTTSNGVANKELLPNNYSFRMTYAYASKDKQQDIGANPTVVFQTVNAAVQLKNSQGTLIDQGTVQYYSGAWRTFGTTTNGTANKELLPNNYSFRMMYEYVSLDKSQDLSTNNTVDFSTVLCTIRVKNTQNQPVDSATASYYSGAWRQIGNTINGEITKELLPVNLTFRIKYGTQQQDKQQNLSTNTVVEFAVQ